MDGQLRVLCVTPTGPEGRGGIDRLFRYVRASELLSSRRGLAMRYFAARGPDLGPAWMLLFPWRVVLFVVAMARWRPHVLHLNFATGGSLVRKLVLARIGGRIFGAAVVVQFHGQFPLDGIARRTLEGRLFLALCRTADVVVALGSVAEGRFRDVAGVEPARLRVVPNGIPDFASGMPLPKAGSLPLRIAFVGKVGDHKGVPILVRALLMLPRNRDWICKVAGDGEVERCAALARDAGLADRLHFLGWSDPGAVHRLLVDTDVVVLPSLSENMPLSLLEGGCAGAALVATAVGETRDIVRHGVNGLLIERTPEALAGALSLLMAEPALLAAMQAASRALYEQTFTLEGMAVRLDDLYRSAARPAQESGLRRGR